MSMRLVWPDETMPRKPKASPDADVAPDDTLEAQDGPVEAQSIEVEADEDAEETPAAQDVDLAILEAMLFATHHPLTGQRLAELLNIKSQKAIRAAVQNLNQQYESTDRTFRIEQVAGGYQLLSLPQYGDILKRLHQKDAD